MRIIIIVFFIDIIFSVNVVVSIVIAISICFALAGSFLFLYDNLKKSNKLLDTSFILSLIALIISLGDLII